MVAILPRNQHKLIWQLQNTSTKQIFLKIALMSLLYNDPPPFTPQKKKIFSHCQSGLVGF